MLSVQAGNGLVHAVRAINIGNFFSAPGENADKA